MPRKAKVPVLDTSNLFRRGSTWWCRIQVRGESRRVSLRTSDVAVAIQERDRLVAEAVEDRAGRVRPVIRRWQDAVEGWLGELEARVAAQALSAATADRYQVSVRGWGHLEGRALAEVSTATITDYVTKRQAAKASPQTIKNDIIALSSVLGYAEQAGWVDSNPARTYDRRRLGGASRKLDPPRDDVLAATLDEIETTWSPTVALLFQWLRETGMRSGEALALHREDILPDGRLRIHRAVKLDRGSGERTRVIELGRAALLLPRLPKTGRLWPSLVEDSTQLASHYGQWRRQRQAREERDAKKEMRLHEVFPRWNAHLLRHAFAVASLVDDPDCVYRLRTHLGHASVSITERYVRHLHGAGADRVHMRRRDLFGSLTDAVPQPVGERREA